MAKVLGQATILVVEDGTEYSDSLRRYLPGPRYLYAQTGDAALARAQTEALDLIYLDMRFDRIPRQDLLGDHAVAQAQHAGDSERAWRYLQNNQGLFILDALTRAGLAQIPVVLAYDFTAEVARLERLQRRYPQLSWVPDAITHREIERLLSGLISTS